MKVRKIESDVANSPYLKVALLNLDRSNTTDIKIIDRNMKLIKRAMPACRDYTLSNLINHFMEKKDNRWKLKSKFETMKLTDQNIRTYFGHEKTKRIVIRENGDIELHSIHPFENKSDFTALNKNFYVYLGIETVKKQRWHKAFIATRKEIPRLILDELTRLL